LFTVGNIIATNRDLNGMKNEIIGDIRERLKSSKSVVVASHVRPDGDAIGSLIGLGLALKDAGKSVQMVLVDGVPSSFKHLEGSELILKNPNGEHDTFITVDCADFKRAGKVFEDYGTRYQY
jgi:phosphoesterase RecJ-like protein